MIKLKKNRHTIRRNRGNQALDDQSTSRIDAMVARYGITPALLAEEQHLMQYHTKPQMVALLMEGAVRRRVFARSLRCWMNSTGS